jgi:hypothetical protein
VVVPPTLKFPVIPPFLAIIFPDAPILYAES